MSNHCGEGIPSRCFKYTYKDGTTFKFCLCYAQWPTVIFPAYPKHPTPDPGPILTIEGISPEITREIQLLDMILYISNHVRGEAGNSIREVAKRNLNSIQLPEGFSL